MHMPPIPDSRIQGIQRKASSSLAAVVGGVRVREVRGDQGVNVLTANGWVHTTTK